MIAQLQNRLIKRQAGGLYWLVTCTEKPYLSSPKIRKAIATAINRHEVTQFLQGGEEPAFSVLPKSLSMLDEQSFQDGNAEAARALFAEGCAELGINPADYPHLKITHWSEPTTKVMAEILQQQLQRALPIAVDLDATNWGTNMKRVPAGDIDIATAPWTTSVMDPMFNLNYLKFKKNGINGTCWQHRRYIDLLTQADSTTDPAERRQLMREAEKIAVDELPLIPLFYMMYKYIKQPNIHGEAISPVGSVEFKWVEKGP